MNILSKFLLFKDNEPEKKKKISDGQAQVCAHFRKQT